MAAAKPARRSANAAAYQSASRARTDSSTRALRLRGQQVARAAARVDEARRRPLVDLTAQPVDVDLDRVGERVVVLVPNVLAELGAPDHPPGVAREVLEHRVLLARERQPRAPARRGLAPRIDDQVADGDRARQHL